jgi:hypothetical protein
LALGENFVKTLNGAEESVVNFQRHVVALGYFTQAIGGRQIGSERRALQKS